MVPDRKVTIGRHEIVVPPKHIYLQPGLAPTYDYVPWNLIGRILSESGLTDARLVDVGANVGDSLAHFRRFSSAPAFCVEPEPTYFTLLEKNSITLGNVELCNALLVPQKLLGKIAFDADGQTGSTRLASDGDSTWSGACVTAETVMNWIDGKTSIIKTDTDGFDAQILSSFLPYLSSNFFPLIFFEGPLSIQVTECRYDEYISICGGLQTAGYKLLLLTNIGMPYAYAGTNTEVLSSCIGALSIGYSRRSALCHYFDIVALHPSLTSDLHSLARPWDAALFLRN